MAERIALIGLGLAGKALASCLLRSGYDVTGFDTDAGARDAAVQMGVRVAASASQAVESVAVVLLSLPDSDVVKLVLWGENGIAEALGEGTVVLDSTTGRPDDARDNARRLGLQGVKFVDVTLSGSSEDIARGEVTALVGDSAEAADYRPVIESFSNQVFFLGAVGSGCLAKLVVNHVMGLNRAVLAEGLALGEKAGMDCGLLLEVLKKSAAYSKVMDIKGDRMVGSQFEPASRIRQHAKDVRLILELAGELSARAPLEQVHGELLEEAIERGWGDLDNAGVVQVFRETDRSS